MKLTAVIQGSKFCNSDGRCLRPPLAAEPVQQADPEPMRPAPVNYPSN